MSWVGTATAYSACRQALLDDIWRDRDHQLDAWQQLYVLACVKLCFRRMWKIGNEAKVSRWTNMDDYDYCSSSAFESSSDERSEGEQEPLSEDASANSRSS
jgi:hypothetical protein